MPYPGVTVFLVTVLALAGTPALTSSVEAADKKPDPKYVEEIESWRKGRLERLKSDTGWLVVAGLFWLDEGDNVFGSNPKNKVVLPAHSAPPRAGVLRVKKGRVQLLADPGVETQVGDKPVRQAWLTPDIPGPYDVVKLGDLQFFVIIRGEKPAIRLRDLRSQRRREFKGIEYFPISEAYRVEAKFESNPPGSTLPIANVLGGTDDMVNPGRLVFELRGQPITMDAILEEPGDDRYFMIFRDRTSGKSTYGAGRFVYTESLPKAGKVVIDFNKAYTPPCGFTPYSTCPLPPPRNRFKVPIEAGEKYRPHP